jgi:4-coumarate--CoA ligase
LGHPKIDDCAVIGIYKKEQATEVPRAYVVPAKGIEGSKSFEKEIMEWLAVRVANHKKLRGGVQFLDEIPRSAAGKILRRVLRDRAMDEAKLGERAVL